tara:strand:- start:1382 stop:1489 length:108 start_codon:yes stop_codon:yes gene_type:complete
MNNFKKNKYIIIKQAISKDLAGICCKLFYDAKTSL